MKSYIEPLNAADALDVLDLYGIDTPGASTAFGTGCSPELAGWTLGNAESVAETCALLGVDIATDLAPDNPARAAAAAKAATKATTHGVAAAAGNRL